MESKNQKHKKYDDEFRLMVLRDYYEHGMSQNAVVHKYGLSCNSLIMQWKEMFPIDSKLLSLSDIAIENYMNQDPHRPLTKEEAQSKRINELEKALAMEKLRSRAYEIMIDLAEKQEGIQIRKKSGAKR
jgi:transposase